MLQNSNSTVPETEPTWRPKNSEIEAKLVKIEAWGRGVGPCAKYSEDEVITAENSKKNVNAIKKRRASFRVAPFPAKNTSTWPQLGSQDGANMAKKPIQKSIIFSTPLGIALWMDVNGFLVSKWSHGVRPPLDGDGHVGAPQGVQVGIKMGSKIEFPENVEKRIWS